MARRKHDIERYLRGEMTPKEMYALEKEALQDPFLSEALEGASQASSDTFLFDLKELNSTVRRRTHTRRPKTISLWSWSLGIAAGLILLAVSSVYIISSLNRDQQYKNLASRKEAVPQPTPEDAAQKAQSKNDSVTAGGQPIALNKPGQQAEAEKKPSSAPARARQQASDAVAASRDDQPAAPQVIAEVAQAEAIESEDQRIVEADLTEMPLEVESRAKADAEAADKKKSESLASRAPQGRAAGVAAFSKTVLGKVTSSEDGMALPGVNVIVKGTNIGTTTDEVGNYQILLSDPKQSLVFSFIGLKSVEVKAENNKEINIQMTPDYASLSEVVVIGASPADDDRILQFAEPRGGRNAFEKYMEEKMHYPEQALENKVEGRVTVQFTVDANGQLGEFKVIKGIGFGCDDEVIRLIKEGPAWSPSKRNDQPVKDKVKVRLKFDIPD